MQDFIQIAPGQFIRSTVIATVHFRRGPGMAVTASVVTTVPSLQGTVHYDVRDPDAISALEALVVDAPKPNPRGSL